METPAICMKNHLVKEIETQLGWGDGAGWSNKDFQELSERIFKSTHKQLSVTTLKRIWGRAEQVAKPSVASLDILAEFAGYSGWRQFCQFHEAAQSEKSTEQTKAKAKNPYQLIALLVAVALGGVVLYAFVGGDQKVRQQQIATSADEVEFSFQKVSTGYPNTVIFQYDVGDIPFDSLFIQQSWDNSKRIQLTKPQGLVTTTYYYPGYFLTKLLVNDQIIREEDLYIPTQGWQGIIFGNNSEMVYLKKEQLKQNGALTVTPDVLEQMNEYPAAQLYLANLTDDPQINSSDFNLETEFRLSQLTEKSICQNIRLTVTGTKDVLGLHFSIPGCVGDLLFVMNKEMISGRDHDLTAFGLDFSEWVKCDMEVRDNRITVSLNGRQVFEHQLSSDIGKIGGVQWSFEGLGEIRSLQLSDAERIINLME